MFCPKCGAEMKGRFCTRCGTEVKKIDESLGIDEVIEENTAAKNARKAADEDPGFIEITDENTNAGNEASPADEEPSWESMEFEEVQEEEESTSGRRFPVLAAVFLAAAILCVAGAIFIWFYKENNTFEEFDPFENLTMTYEGVGPDGKAKASVTTSNPAVQAMNFTMDRNYGLSNGDVVTVTITMKDGQDPVEACKADFKQVPVRLSAEYTVRGLQRYPESAAELSEESIQDMRTQLKTSLQSDIANWNKALVDRSEYLGCYYLVSRDPKNDPRNELFLVERIDVLTNGGDTFSFYYYIAYTNVIIDDDGNVVNDLKEYQPPLDINEMTATETHVAYFGFPTLEDLKNRVYVVDTFEMRDEVVDKPKEAEIVTGGRRNSGADAVFPNVADAEETVVSASSGD